VLAALTLYAWIHPPAVERSGAAPLRARASRAGRTTPGTSRVLAGKLLAARGAGEMRTLADQLAEVAGDEIVEPLRPLVEDLRPGVPDIVIGLYGRVATDGAVDALLELARDRRDQISRSAIAALGEARSARAETFLIGEVDDNHSVAALDALATIGSEPAVAALAAAAETSTGPFQEAAFAALGRIETPAKQAALRDLMDSPSIVTARLAIASLTDIDDDTFTKLAELVGASDPDLAVAAVVALERAGDGAADVLAAAARDGAGELRREAIRVLGSMHSMIALDALREIVDGEDADIGAVALDAIARLGLPEAREIVIETAMADGPLSYAAIDELAEMTGDDVDGALAELAKGDDDGATRALGYLVKRGDAAALDIAVARASTGDDDHRIAAMQLLANAGTEDAFQQLVDVVGTSHGHLRVLALATLADLRPQDPGVVDLLKGSLASGDSEEAAAAARQLASVGSDEARTLLIGALSNGDHDVVSAAVDALDRYRIDDTSAAALARAADANPDIAGGVIRKLVGIGAPSGIELARRAIHGSDDVAIAAIANVNAAGGKASFALIEEAVHVSSASTRDYAVSVIGESGNPRALDVVLGTLSDSDSSVRASAARALGRLGGDRANRALLDLTHSSDSHDRLNAVQNLADTGDPNTIWRVKDLVRSDPSATVSNYAAYALASRLGGVDALASVVHDASVPYEARMRAASALVDYGVADPSVRQWYDAATTAE
jgi:HEAT repeat protein